MTQAQTSQSFTAGTVVRQAKGQIHSRPASASNHNRLGQQLHARHGRGRATVVRVTAAAVQRSDSPSSYQAGPISAPATAPSATPMSASASAPSASQHPDAIKRRRAAEERKQKRTQFTQAMAAGRGWWEIENPPNMHMIATPDEFRERVQLAKRNNSLVVADYFAPWCHACKALHPKMQQLARNNHEVTFISVNAGNEALSKLCEEVGVTQLPYLHFLKGQQGLVGGFAANLTAEKLQQIRAQIQLHKGSTAMN